MFVWRIEMRYRMHTGGLLKTKEGTPLCLATSVGLSLAIIIVAGGGDLVRMPLPR